MAAAVTFPEKEETTMMAVPNDLAAALLEFHRQKANGVIEIHFGQGGVCKIFGTIKKTYK